MNTVGKLSRLLEVGLPALHPDQVRVRSEGNAAHDGAPNTTLVPEISLARSGGVPVKEDILSEVLLCDLAGVKDAVGFLNFIEVLLLEVTLVGGLELLDDGLVEQADARLREPLVLNLLKNIAILAGRFGGGEDECEGF